MKGSKEGRPSSTANAAAHSQHQSSNRATISQQKTQVSQAHQANGSTSQRKSSQNRTGAHSHNKSTNQSTSVKSRQNGGGSNSGHRVSISHGGNQAIPTSLSKENSSANHGLTNYSQYGLVSSSQRKTEAGKSSSGSTAQSFIGGSSAGANQQQIVTSSSNLKSAKAVMNNIQTHQKTKSTQLTNSQGYAQMQAAANEGYNIYQNNVGGTIQGLNNPNSANVSKIAQKHSRHSSNPSWVLLQSGAQNNSQPSADKQQNHSVQITKNQQSMKVSTDASSVGKTRSKQINQSSGIVGNSSQIQAPNSRFNTSKIGGGSTQANSSKISKVQASGNSNSSSINAVANVSSSTTNKTGGAGGHKKSSSMANSKITQLLLKAGSKHYINANLQQAMQAQRGAPQPGTINVQTHQQSVPQKQRSNQQQTNSSSAETQKQQQISQQQQMVVNSAQMAHISALTDSQQQFISSYDVPTRSNDLVHHSSEAAAAINNRMAINGQQQQIYANINKSMDMAQQINAFNHNNHQQQLHQQQFKYKESQADQHLQKILEIDNLQQMSVETGSMSKQELSYQEHLSKYLANKSTKTHTGLLENQQNNMSSEVVGSVYPIEKVRVTKTTSNTIEQRPTSIEILQQQELSKKNPMVLQQPMLIAHQFNVNSQINTGQNLQQSSHNEKIIAKQGKVVSGGGVSVKKPSSSHVKNLSVNNQRNSVLTEAQNMTKQAQQKLAQHGTHQRTKSDKVGSDLSPFINMGKVIQNQKGKVGEILKNNFIDAHMVPRQSAPNSIPHKSSKVQSIASTGDKLNTRTYNGNDRSKVKNSVTYAQASVALSQKQMVAIQNSSTNTKNSSMNTRKSSQGNSSSIPLQISKKAAIAQAKHQNKTIQEKYEELEFKYNELLDLVENKKNEDSPVESQSPMLIENFIQRETNQASLSSISSKGIVGVSRGQQIQMGGQAAYLKNQKPPQMNPRMIRYINNQQKVNNQGDSSGSGSGGMKQQRDQILIAQAENINNKHKEQIASSRLVDTRSADMRTFKHQQLIDMSEMKIVNPFDDGINSKNINNPVPPHNSNQASMPISSSHAQEPQNGIQVNGNNTSSKQRKTHNRVNTHCYGQQNTGIDPNKKLNQIRQSFQVCVENESDKLKNRNLQLQNSSQHLSEAEAAYNQLIVAQRQLQMINNQVNNGSRSDARQSIDNQQKLQGRHIGNPVATINSSALQGNKLSDQTAKNNKKQSHYAKYNGQSTTSRIEDHQSISKTQQTPRTTSQSTENVERAYLLQQQRMQQQVHEGSKMQVGTANAKVVKQDNIQWQNHLATVNVDQGINEAQIQIKGQKSGQKIQGGHRRSVSDGNDPSGLFNFKQGSSELNQVKKVDQTKRMIGNNNVSSTIQHDFGKQSLVRHSMQSRKRAENQQQSTRSHSRTKKFNEHQDLVNMQQPADISSLESSDNHHQPNSQLIFAQISQERKTNNMKKAVKNSNHPVTSSSKEGYVNKKVSNIRKQSIKAPISTEARSSSKGPSHSSKLEVQKKTHQRIKSNSYRHSNKDQIMIGPSVVVSAQIQNNDPSMEGSIQNPSSAMLNTRFIDKQHAQQIQGHQPQKIIIKRGDKQQYVVDMRTQEQHLQQQNPGNQGTKRTFHHPALSQQNPWMSNLARNSQDMFIVQEHTPSTNSIGNVSDEESKTIQYPKINSHQDLNGVSKSSAIGLSPVISQKNKQQGINLIKSHGAASSSITYKDVQKSLKQNVSTSVERQHGVSSSSREHQQYIHVSKKDGNTSAVSKSTNKTGKELLQLEKKRVGVVKNQASKHPICQANATGHIKNKLSNVSEEKRTELKPATYLPVASSSNHKRHKSDNVENQRQIYQPLINPQHQLADKQNGRLPQKYHNIGGKNSLPHRKGETRTVQVSPNVTQKAQFNPNQRSEIFGLKGDLFYAATDKANDTKLVNISIDELNDELPSDAELQYQHNSDSTKEIDLKRKNDRSKWIEVIRENSNSSIGQANEKQSSQLLQERIVMQFEQSQTQNRQKSMERDQQVNEKRKKFMQAYQKKSDLNNNSKHETSFGRLDNQGSEQGNGNSQLSLQLRKQIQPRAAMLIEERNSTEESFQPSQYEQHAKYNNILSIAKGKFKSKSYVPPHLMMQKNKSQSSIDEDQSSTSQMMGLVQDPRQQLQATQVQVLSVQKADNRSQEQYEGIPADSFQQSRKKISINMNIPSEIQSVHQQKVIGGYPNSITYRSLADEQDGSASNSNQKNQPRKSIKSKKNSVSTKFQQQSKHGEEDNQAANNQPHPLDMKNFRGIQSTTPRKKGTDAQKAGIQMNNLIPEDGKGVNKADQQDMRIETSSSIELDVELTTKEKLFKKICKYVRMSFQNNEKGPLTTVDFYRIGKILGKGAFGKVNLALHNLTQHMVAIKSINKQYFGEDSQRRKVLQEVVILKQTRHKHIVRLFEYFETQKHILFVIEIAAGGDLLNYVRKRRQLKEDVAKSVFKQLIYGLHYCHSKGILHRDIKLDNILLSASGEVKICDFGVSKVIRRGQILTEQCGTPAYIAPEILKDRGYEGFGVDVWSSGVVLYAMLYGIVPFRANNMNELQKMIIRADYKLQDCISKEARDILSGLLEKDPAKRLSTRQILAHPWMSDAKDTVELFTQAEKNYIRTEYTYGGTSRYNRNTIPGGLEYESDAFVDAMLDTNENSILKNAETKSVILAPFNSTKSNIETSKEFLDQVRDLLEDKRVVKFAPRVREIAKQYEVNNNAELDNGVQHDFLEEEAKNKAAAQEEENKSHSEIGMLEQLIKQEESQRLTERDGDDDAIKNLEPYQGGSQDNFDTENVMSPPRPSHNGNKLASGEIGEASNSLAPQMHSSLIQSAQTLIIDENIIERVLEYGYPREALVHFLNKNELNNATTAYWLLQMAQQEELELAEAAVAAEQPSSSSQQQRQKSASYSEH